MTTKPEPIPTPESGPKCNSCGHSEEEKLEHKCNCHCHDAKPYCCDIHGGKCPWHAKQLCDCPSCSELPPERRLQGPAPTQPAQPTGKEPLTIDVEYHKERERRAWDKHCAEQSAPVPLETEQELARTITELRAERDDLKRQIAELEGTLPGRMRGVQAVAEEKCRCFLERAEKAEQELATLRERRG